MIPTKSFSKEKKINGLLPVSQYLEVSFLLMVRTTKERRRRNAAVGNIQSSGISFSATAHFSKSPYFV